MTQDPTNVVPLKKPGATGPLTPQAAIKRLEAYIFPPMVEPALDVLAMDLVIAWKASGGSLGQLLQGVGKMWQEVEKMGDPNG